MQAARGNQVFQQDDREKAAFWRGAAFLGRAAAFIPWFPELMAAGYHTVILRRQDMRTVIPGTRPRGLARE
jgi:hypothetical protein